MNTTLRPAPHYFVIESIGGMNEGYSDTTCRRVEDVIAPELAKAMVEDYIDQWIHDIHEHWKSEHGIDVKFGHEECPHGGWHRVYVNLDHFSPDMADVDIDEGHTLFIQVYNSVMLGDAVIIYDQMDDRVRYIATRSHAIRIAEEHISIDVERIKHRLYDARRGGPVGSQLNRHEFGYLTNNLVYAYDCLAEVVRDLEYPQEVMVDIDDTCIHYFPVEKCKRLIYLNGSRITTENID